MTHFAQDVKDIWRLAVPYFKQKTQGEIRLWFIGPVRLQERWIALNLLASIIVLELAFSYIAKMFNGWYNSFYNSLQDKDWAAFKYYMAMFCLIAFFHILISVYKAYINQLLQIRWRKSMTDDFVARWLAPAQHYRMRMAARPVDTTDPSIAHVTGPADNPDQRIAEDVHQFVGNTMVLGIGFFGNAVRLGIFLVILWNLSISFPMTSFGLSFNIPGYLIWIAVIYAALGTLCTHLIGKPLVSLLFHQQRFEANFRFGMARIRENSEQIALLGGEGAERASLFERYGSILANVYAVVRRQKRLGFFTNFFGQFSVIFPFLLLGPAYFFGKATLGTLMQTNQTFSSVQDGLTWFVDAYVSLASYRAVVQRLVGFEAAMAESSAVATTEPRIETRSSATSVFGAEGVVVDLPNGKPLTAVPSFALRRGDRVLLSGRSGSGKTTLLRAFSGIWPFGKGRVEMPEGTRTLILPQRTYLPLGTLRQALVYPETLEAYPDALQREALAAVGLDHLADELDTADNWPQRLSGGEQQRLGAARALLVRPDWLFLDEATSALDEAGETSLYQTLIDRLPEAGIVSITHRPTLNAFHNRRVEMQRGPSGLFQAADALPAAAE